MFDRHLDARTCIAGADPDAELTMAYVTNGVRDDYLNEARLNAMSEAVRRTFVE